MPEIITPEVLEHPMRKDARIVAMDFTTRAVEGDAPIIEYVGSDDSEDRYGSVVVPRGCDSVSYMRSGEGVFCFAHRYDIPTIGKCVKLDQKASKLVFTIQFAVEEFDFAATIYRLVKGGYMSGSSIGFIPKEWEDYEAKTVSGYFAENRKYTKWELLELSAVPVPANRNALKLALSDNVVTENEMRAFGLDQFIRGELLYIMPRSLNLIVDKDGSPIQARETAPIPEPPAKEPEQKAAPKITPKESRHVALRSALKIARTELRDCWGDCEQTVYSYCPLCWAGYVGNPPTAQCNCMENLSGAAAAAEQKSIASMIDVSAQMLDAALSAWDTAEHDALRNFASMCVWESMWRVDRLLTFEDFWYEDAEEGTVAASVNEELVRKFATTVQKDAALMKRFEERAGAVLSAKNKTRVENARTAAKQAHDHLDDLMKEAFPEDGSPAPATLDDEQKKNAFRVICDGCKTERTVEPKDGVVTLASCATCDAKRGTPAPEPPKQPEEIRCVDEKDVATIISGIRSLASPAGEAGTTEGDIEGSSTADRDVAEPDAATKREGYSDTLRYIMNMN